MLCPLSGMTAHAVISPDAQQLITFALGSLVSCLVLVGLATRYVLVPYLQTHLVQPVRETHQQVTENHHASPGTPTLPDRLEDLHTDVRTLTRLLDLHVSWSLHEHFRIDRELAEWREQHDDTSDQGPGPGPDSSH